MKKLLGAVGITVDIAGWVITFVLVPLLSLGIFAAVILGPSDMAHAGASTDTFLLGAVSAVMLLGMLIAGCFAFVSQRHRASFQQGNDYAMQPAYPSMLGPIQVDCGIAMPHAAHDVGEQYIAEVNNLKHGRVDALHRVEHRGSAEVASFSSTSWHRTIGTPIPTWRPGASGWPGTGGGHDLLPDHRNPGRIRAALQRAHRQAHPAARQAATATRGAAVAMSETNL